MTAASAQGLAKPQLASPTDPSRAGARYLGRLPADACEVPPDRSGATLDPPPMQEVSRGDEAMRQADLLDALPAHIALLDLQGRIVWLNEAWRRFAGADPLRSPHVDVGCDYLALCTAAAAAASDAPEAVATTDGIRSVLAGSIGSFSSEYLCRSPTDEHRFIATVTPLEEEAAMKGAIVMHVDITASRRVEKALLIRNADLEHRARTHTADLGAARDLAEHESARAKSDLVAMMSHEIRTPMSGVIGIIGLLQQSALSADQQSMAELALDSATSLLASIDDILDYSHLDTGKTILQRVPLQFGALVEDVCAMLDQLAMKRGVRMTMYIDPGIPVTVLGDATRLRQVLVNLIANAFKFSIDSERPAIVAVRAMLISREGDDAEIELSIADNGIGIDEATLLRLFTRFSQSDVSITRRFGGGGLGLAVSSTLVGLMDGLISVVSAPGEGSTFSVRLHCVVVSDDRADDATAALVAALQCRIVGQASPLADDLHAYLRHAGARLQRSTDVAAAAAAEPPDGASIWLILPSEALPTLAELRALAPQGPRAQTRFLALGWGARRTPRVQAFDLVGLDADMLPRRLLFEALALLAGRIPGEMPADPAAALPMRDPARLHEAQRRDGRRILVADDNETSRGLILRQLATIGWAAEGSVSGYTALGRWRSGEFALLLTGLHMPGMDGYALAAAIRSEEGARHRAPIIGLTVNAQHDEQTRCLAAGMDGYLGKPVRLLQLKSEIEQLIGPATPGRSGAADGAGSSQAADPPADIGVLAALVGDDVVVIEEIVQAFLASSAQTGVDICRVITDDDAECLEILGSAAHRLKSAARTLGALRLAELCAEIEDVARTSRPDQVGTLQSLLATELERVRMFLTSH